MTIFIANVSKSKSTYTIHLDIQFTFWQTLSCLISSKYQTWYKQINFSCIYTIGAVYKKNITFHKVTCYFRTLRLFGCQNTKFSYMQSLMRHPTTLIKLITIAVGKISIIVYIISDPSYYSIEETKLHYCYWMSLHNCRSLER